MTRHIHIAILLLFLVGCANTVSDAPRPTPSTTALPTPSAAIMPTPSPMMLPTPSDTARPTPSATLLPTSAPPGETTVTAQATADNPLRQSLEALRRVQSFRWTTNEQRATGERSTTDARTTLRQTADARALPDERTSATFKRAEDVREDVFCDTTTDRFVCWSRVGAYPWTEQPRFLGEGYRVIQTMERDLSLKKIISTSVATETNQLAVEWRMTQLIGSSTQVVTGTTWIDQTTLLPMREHGVADFAGTPIGSFETVFSEYDVPVTLTPPVIATVTPAPTVVVPPLTTEAPRIEQPPFPGKIVLPSNVERAPAVILLHGSGGLQTEILRIAEEWARRGFVVVALCYFGCEGTPATLNDVPVESVGRAIDYLRGRDDVDPDAIGVVGYSRGAEFALIAGVLDSRIRAVVSMMGSNVVVPGYPNGGNAWTYQGKPLPWSTIPVERIDGPVLVVHGERDDLWLVTNSYHIADRLQRYNHPFELVVYPGAGHTFGLAPDATDRSIAFMQQALGR